MELRTYGVWKTAAPDLGDEGAQEDVDIVYTVCPECDHLIENGEDCPYCEKSTETGRLEP